MKMSTIRVLLADDHAVVRQGLRSLMESYADMVVVGEAGNGVEAVAMADASCPMS
jgi:DNA-binding NarL/FixJ family response regulator